MTKTTIPELLPKDLVEEILCRVPATSLKRLRSTCKAWNRLFKDDRRFARKHFDKAAKHFIPLSLRNDYKIFPISVNLHGNSPSVDLKSELIDPHFKNSAAQFVISRVFHCDGLLLCSSQFDESRFVVWNPLTGETRWIRTGNFRKEGRNFDLGYVYHDDNKSCYKSYKILSFYRGTKYFEIYDFDSDSWKILDDMIAPGGSTGYSELSVSLKGNIYWFVRGVITETPRIISLLKFDFSTEKSVPVPLPYQSRRFEATSLSVVREEKLSVLLQRDRRSKTEIWLTNKIDETTKVVSWSKVLALDLNPDLQIWHDGSFLLGEEKKVVICCERLIDNDDVGVQKCKAMVYIVGEDNVVTEVKFGVDEMEGCLPVIFNYVPSLVHIERAGGNRKKSFKLF